jgi:hypothetical protein
MLVGPHTVCGSRLAHFRRIPIVSAHHLPSPRPRPVANEKAWSLPQACVVNWGKTSAPRPVSFCCIRTIVPCHVDGVSQATARDRVTTNKSTRRCCAYLLRTVHNKHFSSDIRVKELATRSAQWEEISKGGGTGDAANEWPISHPCPPPIRTG